MKTVYLEFDDVLGDRASLWDGFLASDKQVIDQDWRYHESINKFQIYKRMEVLPTTTELLRGLINRNLRIEMLSAITHTSPKIRMMAEMQKRDWLIAHGFRLECTFVYSQEDKSKLANPDTILIDNNIRALTSFIAAGGIGIHFDGNLNETLTELDEYLQ